MAIQRIQYTFHDPSNTSPYWQGFLQDFDDTIVSVADKLAEQYNLRTVGKSESYFRDLIITNLSSGGGGIDTNLGTDNLTQIDPSRTFNINGGVLNFNGAGSFGINQANPLAKIHTKAGAGQDAFRFDTPANGLGFKMDLNGRISSNGNVFTAQNDPVDPTRGGVGVNGLWGNSGIKPDFFVRAHSPNDHAVNIRALTSPNKSDNTIGLVTNWSNVTGFRMVYNTIINHSKLIAENDLELTTLASTGTNHVRIAPRGILGKSFKTEVQGGGASEIDFICEGLRTYLKIELAQGDASLPLNAMYRTTGGNEKENSTLRVKF